jgi:hypothetical protein
MRNRNYLRAGADFLGAGLLEGFSAGLFEGFLELPLLLQPGLVTVGGTVGGVGPPTKANEETDAKTRARANNGVFMGLKTLSGRGTVGNCILIAIMRGQDGGILGQLLKGKHLPRHLS